MNPDVKALSDELAKAGEGLGTLTQHLWETFAGPHARELEDRFGRLRKLYEELTAAARKAEQAEGERARTLRQITDQYRRANADLQALASSGPAGLVKALGTVFRTLTAQAAVAPSAPIFKTAEGHGPERRESLPGPRSPPPADVHDVSPDPRRPIFRPGPAPAPPARFVARTESPGPSSPVKGPSLVDARAASSEASAAAAAGPEAMVAAVAVGAALMVGKALSDAIRKAVDPAKELAALVAPIQEQVRLFDPGQVERFQMALEDLSAAIGSMFGPAIEAVQAFANDLNAVLTELSPAVRPLVEAVSQAALAFGRELLGPIRDFASALLDAARPLAEALQPLSREVGKLLAENMDLLTESIPPVVAALTGLVQITTTLIQANRDLLQVIRALASGDIQGLLNVFRNPSGSQAGAGPQTGPRTVAARPARTIGIEDVGREARLAAFGAASVQQQQLQTQQLQLQTQQGILQALQGLLGAGGSEIVEAAGSALGEAALAVVAPPWALLSGS